MTICLGFYSNTSKLTQLRICDFILIKEQEIALEPGLNVLTGETGAGKSIVLQAIQILLGAKVKDDLVRPGAEQAVVEGLFNLESVPQSIRLELPDILHSEELLINRTISSSGRSKVYINGRLSSLSLLEELRPRLVNICGQNQQVRLLDTKYHLQTLDGYLNDKELFENYSSLYSEFEQLKYDLKQLESKLNSDSTRQRESLMIVEDLADLDLQEGARANLENEKKRLQGAERLLEICSAAANELSSEAPVSFGLKNLQLNIAEISKLDPKFGEEMHELFNSAKSSLSEIESSMNRYPNRVEIDQKKLDIVRDQLAKLAQMMRKYRCSERELKKLLSEAQSNVVNSDDSVKLNEIRQKLNFLEEKVQTLAKKISAKRKNAALNLSKEVEAGLAELNLKGAKFIVSFADTSISKNGIDQVEFQISTNKGLAAKSLKDVASGGELSRILLVLKQALREVSGVNVLIFDEVDTGISGSVARAVGERLKDLAKRSQVLCITHLAQVASLADHHLVVNKTQDKLATTVVKSVIGESRIDEIARMLSGHKVTTASRQTALELLKQQ